MKKKILAIIALMLVTVVSLSSCMLINSVRDLITDIFNPKIELTDEALNTEKLIDFANGANPDVLFESDGWTNGDVFNVVWKKSNVKYENGIMLLGITEEKATAWLNDAEVEFNYTAGEARTQNYYGYGDFEVSMKPSANPGTASTFFTCTGPYDIKYALDENGDFLLDENGQRIGVENPHDEIDIEFLGNDTTHVQFNFFVDGKGGNEYMHDLGFDASEDFHTYGYRWEPTAITWFVDGVPVYKVTTDTSVEEAGNVRIVEKLPSAPGRILTNYWCGNERAEGWMGKYIGAIKDQGTEYRWIATGAEGAPLNPPEKPNEEIEGIDWSKIDSITPTFDSTELYTVTTEGTSTNISYTEVGGSCYKNVEMDITEESKGKNYLHLVVTNNGENAVRFRVNVVDMALVEAGAQNMSTNDSATVNGEAAWTDHEWGGSFFDLAAGETYEIVIVFKGEVEKLQLMPDSSKNDSSVNAGNITVSEIKFTTVGEVVVPHSCKDADGDDICDECGHGMIVPPSLEDEGLQLNFWTSSNNYTANGNNIKYNGAGNSYSCAGADIASVAAGKTTFTVTITNNGAAASKVRVDIQGENQIGNHTVINTDATGGDVWTDMEWGGSSVTVAPGESVTLVVTYDVNTDRGAPTNLVVFVDAARGDDGTYNSDITLSGMAFSGEAEIPTPPEQGGDDPDPTPDPTPDPEEPKVEYTDLYVEFKTENAYTLTSPDTYANSVRVTYSDIAKNSWSNINIWVADKSAGCGIFTFKLTNHGENTVSVWVQMKDAAGAELINENKNIAAGAEEIVSFNYSGEAQMVFFFVDSTHEAAADSNAGDITISELKLGKAEADTDPDGPGDVVTPSTPEGEYLSFTGNECYTLSATPDEYVNSIDVTYSSVSDNTYQNVNTWIKDKAAGKNTVHVAVTNNGTETVYITVKLEAAGSVALGEYKMEIAPGQTKDVVGGFSGEAELLFFFIDSGWSAETQTHAGNVTISDIYFQ